jgi:hypothetical protein
MGEREMRTYLLAAIVCKGRHYVMSWSPPRGLVEAEKRFIIGRLNVLIHSHVLEMLQIGQVTSTRYATTFGGTEIRS